MKRCASCGYVTAAEQVYCPRDGMVLNSAPELEAAFRTEPTKPQREAWLKPEIARIKAGGTIRLRCVMASDERVAVGLCRGDVPDDRAHRGSSTCSAECQNDRKRLARWELAKGSCRYCGHGLPRPRKKKAASLPVRDPVRQEEPLLFPVEV